MRLYHSSQLSQNTGLQNTREWMTCWMVPLRQVIESQKEVAGDLIGGRKLPNPVLAFHQQHTALHQELLFCHKRGLLPRAKSELQCVLEHKRREKQRSLDSCPPSDLELKLCTRRQRLQAYELEEKQRGERQQTVPEFVTVRGTLRRTQTFS